MCVGLVFVHGWSENLDHMKIVTDGVDSSVRVVNPKEFADLITRNVSPDQLAGDNFNGGLDASWTSSGDVTSSPGSVRIGQGGYIEKTFSTIGHYSVGVDFDMAMTGLSAGDAVKVEVDDGSGAWATMMTMEAGSANTGDGNMHSFTRQLSSTSDDGSIKLRFSVVVAPLRMLQNCATAGNEAKSCSGRKGGGVPKKCCGGLVCSGNFCAADPTPIPTSMPSKSPSVSGAERISIHSDGLKFFVLTLRFFLLALANFISSVTNSISYCE